MKVIALLVFVCATLVNATLANDAQFATELLKTIVKERTSENVLFSPASIQTCLALAYLGTEGETANELHKGLRLNHTDKEEVAADFGRLLEKTKTGGAKLEIANRIYLGDKYEISSKFNELANKYFDSEAKNLKFSDSEEAAKEINSWIEQKTDNKIKNIISKGDVNEQTAAVLVNAIYFKADWKNSFKSALTKTHDFFVSKTNKVAVDMMSQEDHFLYGDLSELDATAVELPYDNTDITMLIILPKSIDQGLANLEDKLANFDLTKISKKLSMTKIHLQMPKFKYEFEISLNDALKKLGMESMFSDAANFNQLLATKTNLAVSEVKHKAFIEVNEDGTVAAASTAIKIAGYLADLSVTTHEFIADHPFFFAIKDSQTVYFAGHVAQI